MGMRVPLLVPALAAAALGLGASGASAATVYTSATHTTRVAVSSSQTLTTSVGRSISLTSGGLKINECTHTVTHTTTSQNSGTVRWTVVASGFAPCNSPMTGNHATPWSLTVTGTGTASGGFTRWSAAIDGVSFNLLGGTYTGSLTTGVTVTQPTAAGAPICLHLNTAGSVAGPLTGDGRLNGTQCFTGTAASYSLTN